MSRKKIMLSVLGLVVVIVAGYGAIIWFSDDRTYTRELNKARDAVAVQDWQTAKKHYQASRQVRVSVENRTASEQLNDLERADAAIKKQNWESAQSLYQRAIDTDGGVDLLKKAAKTNQRFVTAKKDTGKYQSSASSLQKSVDKKDSELKDLKKQMSESTAAAQAAQSSADKALADAKANADNANKQAESAASASQKAADDAKKASESSSKDDDDDKDKDDKD